MKKSNLPTKFCPVCNRDFTWRKKWIRVWNNVIIVQRSLEGIRVFNSQSVSVTKNQKKFIEENNIIIYNIYFVKVNLKVTLHHRRTTLHLCIIIIFFIFQKVRAHHKVWCSGFENNG
jgi:hypothetical protein